MSTSRQEHWEAAYADGPAEVSWFESRPNVSLALVETAQVPKDGGIIDVGGGSSTLVDCLLDAGYLGLAVLDLSASALGYSRARLGERASAVEWIEEDITSFAAARRYALWHDRAVFHFLTAPADRQSYLATLRRTLEPRGGVIIATFAPDGPAKCSGLEVVRYDEASISAELGRDFVLEELRRETHATPWQTEQQFNYFRFHRV